MKNVLSFFKMSTFGQIREADKNINYLNHPWINTKFRDQIIREVLDLIYRQANFQKQIIENQQFIIFDLQYDNNSGLLLNELIEVYFNSCFALNGGFMQISFVNPHNQELCNLNYTHPNFTKLIHEMSDDDTIDRDPLPKINPKIQFAKIKLALNEPDFRKWCQHYNKNIG